MTSALGLLNSHLTFKTVDSKMAEVIEAASGDKPLEKLTAFFDFYKLACRTRGHYLPRQLQKSLLEICSTKDPLERTAKIQAAFRVQFPAKVERLDKCDWEEHAWIQTIADLGKFTEEDREHIWFIQAGGFRLCLIGEFHNTLASKRLITELRGLADESMLCYFMESISRYEKDELFKREQFRVKTDSPLFGLEDRIDNVFNTLFYLPSLMYSNYSDTVRDENPDQRNAISLPSERGAGSKVSYNAPLDLLLKFCCLLNENTFLMGLWNDALATTAASEMHFSKTHPIFTAIDRAKQVKDIQYLDHSAIEPLFRDHTLKEAILFFHTFLMFAFKNHEKGHYSESERETLISAINNIHDAKYFNAARDLFMIRRDRHFAKTLLDPTLPIPKEMLRVAPIGRYHLPGTYAALQEIASGKAAPAESKADSKGDSKASFYFSTTKP